MEGGEIVLVLKPEPFRGTTKQTKHMKIDR